MQTIIVTGAAGFIGSALCRYLRRNNLARVIGIDAMTYAASREAVGILANDPLFSLIEADITEAATMAQIFMREQPDALMHLAAETHVDRSIDRPGDFLRANIVGTFSLLETTRVYLHTLEPKAREAFRFLHVSTDEVYGSLGANDPAFTEETPYDPSSPYSASKAASDHLARAWFKTYGVPVVISNCSNNYGPLQFPEKLLPLCVTKALHGEKLPIYGQGINVRDWLYVDDHARALYLILTRGRLGEKYNIGGAAEKRNIDVIHMLCDLMDELKPDSPYKPHRQLITFVEDRPGHDVRYAMDFAKIKNELGWEPQMTFEDGLRETVQWYINNQSWCENIRARKYAGQRLGQKGE